MASAGASGTVTVEEQRSYIKIETLRGKNPTEIRTSRLKLYVVKAQQKFVHQD